MLIHIAELLHIACGLAGGNAAIQIYTSTDEGETWTYLIETATDFGSSHKCTAYEGIEPLR